MKKQQHFFMWLLGAIIMLSSLSMKAQNTYTVTIQNQAQVSCNVYEFDIYIKRVLGTWKLAQFQIGLNFNAAMLNGGTISVLPVPLSSQLTNQSQAPYDPAKWAQSSNTIIIGTPVAPPGSGTASTIPTTGLGHRYIRLRVVNSVPFSPGTLPALAWSFTGGTGSYQTKFFAYVGTTNTDITVPASHAAAAGAAFGTPTTAVTGTVNGGGEICNTPGATGIEVGVDGASDDLAYQLFRDDVAVDGALAIGGLTAGGSLSFGPQMIAGTYTVKALTCTGYQLISGDAVISVIEPLAASVTITADPGTTVAPGTSVAFTATPVNGGAPPSFLWYVNGTADAGSFDMNPFIYTPVDGDQIYAEMYSTELCVAPTTAVSNTLTMTVGVVTPAPLAFAVTGGGSYCAGGAGLPVGLAGSELGVTYTITPGGATVAGTGAAVTFGNQFAGTYTVSGTNAGGTTAMTGDAVIVENALPVATIAADGPTTFCAGGSVTLTASPVGSYLWSNGATTPSITVSDAGSYTVTVTVAGCSDLSDATVVTVNPIPVATIAADGPTTFCAGGSVTLTASPVGSYLWSNGATTPSITVSDAGSYTVTVTVAGCSDLSDATVVTVNPIPVATILAGGPTTFCQGGFVVLTASAGDSWLWSNNETTQSITVTTGGVYSVQVTSLGCSATSLATEVTVTENVTPSVSIVADFTTVVAGTTVNFTATPANGGTPSYQWYVNNLPVGSNLPTFSFVPVNGDFVKVEMTSSLGCVTAATVTSNVVTITVTAVILPPAAFAVTGGGAYCQGAGGLPVGLSGSELGVTYTLTPGGATVAGTGAAVSFGNQLAGTYTAAGSNGTYTTNMTGNAVITENPLPGPAGAISGLATVTEGTNGVAYSVVIPNATDVYWSYTDGAVVINGNGTSAVTLDFPVGAASGTLTAFGQNDCGVSGSVTLDITVDEIVVLVPVAATWNGSVSSDWFVGGNWTTEVGAVVPAATTTVLIPGGLTTYPTLTAPAACASFTINDGGSFIGSEFLTASSVLVKRDITNTKAHFLSTPVSGTTIGGVFSNSLTVWAREYVALSGTWVFRYLTDPFVVGKGYNVSTTTPSVTANFVGALNTPPVFAGALSTANGGWNLLGNPYTSAIDWDGVVLNNVSASVAVWDGFNILGAPTAGYRYYSSSTGIGTFGFTGIIPAENGFFVTATGASASIDMPAATRVHSTAPFFKGSLANVLRVNVAGNSLNDETVIHFENAATANFDNFDGKKLDSDASLFSVVNGDRLWLNSFPLEGNEVVDLGFKANADGEYTFTASGIESFDGFTPVLLEDLKLNKVQDLRQNANYSFSYVNGDSENRFKLHFKNANGMGDLNTTGISVYSLDKSVVINNNTQLAGEVWIYDVTGRELIHTSMSSDAKTIIPVKAPTANYMVKVVTANGSVNQKVFIR